MFHIFLNIFDISIYMFDMLIDISICLLIIYIYTWAKGCDMEFNRSSKFLKVFFTINSTSHAFWTILSASILTFSCGSNGMGPDI